MGALRSIGERIRELVPRIKSRALNADERALAQTVFASSIPYDRVFITDLNMGGAVTLANPGDIGERPFYTINWVDGFKTTTEPENRPATLIHELTHVWQGHNGALPGAYMFQSMGAQLRHGVEDIWKRRQWRGWSEHRSTAYVFTAADIGRPWSDFNAEQQASLVQSWFMDENHRVLKAGGMIRTTTFGDSVFGGGRSEHDPRFPYIRDVIRPGNRKAGYRALKPIAGADPQIRAVQDRLVQLGYLDARHADGVIGASRSATLDAVAEFQRRNGLGVDRILGGANSETRRKLAQSLGSLVRR